MQLDRIRRKRWSSRPDGFTSGCVLDGKLHEPGHKGPEFSANAFVDELAGLVEDLVRITDELKRVERNLRALLAEAQARTGRKVAALTPRAANQLVGYGC
jgi:hypothetical protein